MQFFRGFPDLFFLLILKALPALLPPNLLPPGGGKLCAIFQRVHGFIVFLVINSIATTLTPKPIASGQGETMCNFSEDSRVYSCY